MTRTLRSLVDERATIFVGREPERSALLELLDDDGPVVAFVCGLAGIGKSSLLAAFADEARASGAAVVAIDGEVTEPTAEGFLRQVSAAVHRDVASVEAAASAIGARGRRVVLTVDVNERLRLIDDWLRRVFIPALATHVRVVIAGRDAPLAAWAAAYGPLLRVIELDTLGAADAVELLRRLGVPSVRAVPINRVLRGHPLSLRLAASMPSTLAGADEAALRPATDELARVYLTELDPATRCWLDAASVVRRVTVPLLDAMLGQDADAAFAGVRTLPFVSDSRDGLVVHHVVREAVSGQLRAADAPRHRRLRTAAWRQLRHELDDAPEHDLWRYTADMLFLLESPAVRDAFFPTSAQVFSVEPARAGDGAAIAAISARHESGVGADLQRAWWDEVPDAFYVARDAGGAVAGYSAVCEPKEVPARLIDRDPIASAWRDHGRASPLARGQRSLFIRFMCGAESGERPAPDVSALYLDLKRTYLTMRPALRRIYTCAHNLEAMGGTLEPLGFTPIGEPLRLGEREYAVYCNDLGPASIDGWLADLAARDVLAHPPAALDADERALHIDGDRIPLSPLEFGVLACLHAREDQVVRRETLLREVWRSEWDGDGNALESVVSALRRKLGRRSKALETVRGVGYRLRPLT